MAVFSVSGQVNFLQNLGIFYLGIPTTINSLTTTNMMLSTSNGIKQDYQGSFSYTYNNGNYDFNWAESLISGLKYYENDILKYTISGVNIPGVTYKNFIDTNDGDGLKSYAFSQNDTFSGSKYDEALYGYGGNDLINGAAGNDTLDGGTGNDTLDGGTGNDTLDGGGGIDTFNVTGSIDTITDLGNGGVDILKVASGATANASLAAAWTATSLSVNNGTENITTNGLAVNMSAVIIGKGFKLTNTGAATTLTGSDLNDTIIGGEGNDSIAGSGGNDSLTGGGGVDTFDVTGTNVTITDLGNGGADILKVSFGATANATLAAAWTATSLSVNNGTENITTNGLAINISAVITGNGFNITNKGAATGLKGSGLADKITGSNGNDTITGGVGTDTLSGGNGNDVYIINGSSEHTSAEIKDTGGIDEVRFSATTSNATLTLYAADTGIDKVTIGTGVDPSAIISGTTALNIDARLLIHGVSIFGNAGANILTSSGLDILTGGGGIDTFEVTALKDTITDLGNGGADILKVSSGATANANIAAAWTATSASVNNGTENINTNGLAVNISEVITGNGFKVTNTGSATTLTGSSLDDTITGGNGNDTISGGAGADKLYGNKGSDTFLFAVGDSGPTINHDKIYEFAKGATSFGDIIDYSAALSIGGSANIASSNQASIDTHDGIATFARGSGNTISDALQDIVTSLTAATDSQGEFAFFQLNHKGNFFVFISDGTSGVSANDLMIELVGVSTLSNIDLTGGNLYITN